MSPASASPRPASLLVWAVLALVAFWLLSQLTVSTWLARQSVAQGQLWQSGQSPWQWDFSSRNSIVHSASYGIAHSQHQADGLTVTLPDDGVLDLVLALHGRYPAQSAVQTVRLEIELPAYSHVSLLIKTEAGGHPATWAGQWLEAGRYVLDMPLQPQATRSIRGLQLRLDSKPHGVARVRRLALMAPDCIEPAKACNTRVIEARPTLMPEQLLAWRDRQLLQEPAARIVVTGLIGNWAAHLAALPGPAPVWPGAVLLLFLIGLGLRRRWQRCSSSSRRLITLELLLPLGLALTTLLAGWPARDTPWPATGLLILCLMALALPPAPPMPPWQWFGPLAAWRSLLKFTVLALVLLLPLIGLQQDSPVRSQDFSRSWRYPVWALIQQWLLMTAIVPRLKALLHTPAPAALAAGLVFGLLHAPNFALMLLTAAGGTAWAWLGLRHRALLPLAASHAVLGALVPLLAPTWLLRSAEIGGRYLMAP